MCDEGLHVPRFESRVDSKDGCSHDLTAACACRIDTIPPSDPKIAASSKGSYRPTKHLGRGHVEPFKHVLTTAWQLAAF